MGLCIEYVSLQFAHRASVRWEQKGVKEQSILRSDAEYSQLLITKPILTLLTHSKKKLASTTKWGLFWPRIPFGLQKQCEIGLDL